ncbi:hypothetical protein Grass_151 [Bacillus phage Grass]|uniref:Uncharacterized protein n=1 Tax=Bacillus phage Grass TaxID=1406785 RepID=U5PUE2_BPGRA|nr:hypothetical protein Grass_151 [Bacillus phage Grass]AGY47416.1 hypothetical protein Grass_151 [Bacillus phage Grass]
MNKYTQFEVLFKGESFTVTMGLIEYFEKQAYSNPVGEIDVEFLDGRVRKWYGTDLIIFCRNATKAYHQLVYEDLKGNENAYVKRMREEKDPYGKDDDDDY